MSAPLRIVMLVSSDLDHDPRVQKTAFSAHRAGHHVTVVCRRASLAFPFEVIQIRSPKTSSSGVMRRLLDRMQFQIRCITSSPSQVTIVHANDLDMLIPGWLLARKSHAALLYDSHEHWTELPRGIPAAVLAVMRWVEGALCRRADSVVTVSELIANDLAAAYNIPKPAVVLNTPEYVDVTEYAGADDRRRSSRSGTSRLVLFHGLYSARAAHGLDLLLESVRFFPDDVTLGLRGYGTDEERLRRRVRELGVERSVMFFEPVPMKELITSAFEADIGVVPLPPDTRQNLGTSPNKLFEYLMAGLPVAISRIPSMQSIVDRYGVGVVFDIYDPTDIARCIAELLEPDSYDRAKANSLRAARSLNWEREYLKLEAEYSAIAPT